MQKGAPSYRVKGKRVYRQLGQQELDAEYDARGSAPDGQKYRDFLVEQSQKAIRELDCMLDVPYGTSSDEVLDIFPADQPN